MVNFQVSGGSSDQLYRVVAPKSCNAMASAMVTTSDISKTSAMATANNITNTVSTMANSANNIPNTVSTMANPVISPAPTTVTVPVSHGDLSDISFSYADIQRLLNN